MGIELLFKTKAGVLACKLNWPKALAYVVFLGTQGVAVMSLCLVVSLLTQELPEDRGQVGFILGP